ncbi:MAG: IMP cyclohydrolase [Candidatus Pacebacteria bacterium]|nr:IMP cyclohydrolase [Candidatus Paceibacterota bacterium]
MNKLLDSHMLADANLFVLSMNPYPGRGIVLGMNETGENLILVYWIMDQNRFFTFDADGSVSTKVADSSKLVDTPPIVYNAMREIHHDGVTFAVVSSGDQTDAIVEGLGEERSFTVTHRSCLYEPDAPNFTPRISAYCFWTNSGASVAEMAVLKKSLVSDACNRHFYDLTLEPGFGYCVTTYKGDGTPLPSFDGTPYLVPLRGHIQSIASAYWDSLNSENRVSLVVKFIPKNGPSQVFYINKF